MPGESRCDGGSICLLLHGGDWDIGMMIGMPKKRLEELINEVDGEKGRFSEVSLFRFKSPTKTSTNFLHSSSLIKRSMELSNRLVFAKTPEKTSRNIVWLLSLTIRRTREQNPDIDENVDSFDPAHLKENEVVIRYAEDFPDENMSGMGMGVFDPNEWKVAMLVDKQFEEKLYFVVYHETDSAKPLALYNPWEQAQYIGIVAEPPFIQPGAMMTLCESQKHLYDSELKRRGIRTPWKRNKRCWKCNVRNSECLLLRVCEGCHVARFCSRHCQKADWKHEHRFVCKEIAYRHQDC